MATIYTAYDIVGVKEDVSDIITNISPTQAPFLTSIGNEKVTQRVFEWQTDVLRTPQGVSAARIEGADASFATAAYTTMLTNYTQIFSEAIEVSGTLEATSLYGRARESAYQLAKSAAALKRDLETALVGTAQSSTLGSDAAAANMAGVQAQVDSGTVYHMGASTNLAETGANSLVTALQQVYTNGADPKIILVNPANSLIVAGWATATGRTRFLDNNDEGGREIVNVIDIYRSPFGQQKVVIDRFCKSTVFPLGSTAGSTIIYDPDYFAKMTLRPWTRETLAKTGDALKMMIVGEFSLKCKAPKGTAVVVDNAASGF
jgi:hypothetical protein